MFSKLITFLQTQLRFEQMQQKRPAGTRQTEGKILVLYGTLEIKSANLTMTTFTYYSTSYLFYGVYIYPPTSLLYLCSPVYIEQPNWAE
jgi:hypothetical protein